MFNPHATQQDAEAEHVHCVGAEDTTTPWILSDRDVWYANPFYSGPPCVHPDDYEEITYDELDRRMAELSAANERVDYLGECSQELERRATVLGQQTTDADAAADDAYARVQEAKKALGEITDEELETMDDEPDVENFCPDVDGPGGRW